MNLNEILIQKWHIGDNAPNISSIGSLIIIDGIDIVAYKIDETSNLKALATAYLKEKSKNTSKYPYSIVEKNIAAYIPNSFYEDGGIIFECLAPEYHEDYFIESTDEELFFDYHNFVNDYKVVASQVF